MDFDWIIPIIIVLIIFFILFSIFSMVLRSMGFDIPSLIWALRGTRRVKMEVQARDHYDRWVEGHRRSAKDNKPPLLRWLYITGDVDVPAMRMGKIKGIEKWKTTNIVYLRTSLWQLWSSPFLVPEVLSSDIHGKNLWVRCRGFSQTHPVRMPIPLASDRDVWPLIHKTWEDFRLNFELQIRSDITENMAWGVDMAMQPPYRALRMAAEVQQPVLHEVPRLKEEDVIGKENQ